MKKRVLFISAGIFPIPANRGGAVEELIDTFTENNALEGRFDVSVASCAFEGKEIKKKTPGVQYHYFKTPFYISLADRLYYLYVDKIKKDWRSLFRQHYHQSRHYIGSIVKRLELDSYDVIVVENNMSLLQKLSEALGESFSRKCMYHMHSSLIDNEAMIPYIARCRKVLAVSDFVKKYLYETVSSFRDTEIEKVTNGIKLRECPDEKRQSIRSVMRERYGVREDETIYLFAGRVSPEKGVYEMVRAFVSALPDLKHKSRLFVVGSAVSGSNKENYYYRQIRQIADRYPESIALTGYIEHASVTDYHIMSDVQIVPSIMDDPAPLTVLEGMSMGTFLLLSRVGGIPEYAEKYGKKIFFERDERLVENIRTAILQYDEAYAPHRYPGDVCLFGEELYYRELAEAIDVPQEIQIHRSKAGAIQVL